MVFSGLQPSGVLHVGNFLGVFENLRSLGEGNFSMCSIVDLHAMTTQSPGLKDIRLPKAEQANSGEVASIKESIRVTTAALLAAKIKPSALFVQSHVAAHSQLAWILGCYTPLGWLSRMTQFKDKGRGNERSPASLLTYPVLMAADMLLYDADLVPVGDDQRQHLEFARDLAHRFNKCVGRDIFKAPEGVVEKGNHSRIMSLKDGTKKMSKSDPSSSYISLLDTKDEIKKKIASARTDPGPIPSAVSGLEGRPEARNLISIYGALKKTTLKKALEEWAEAGWKDFKVALGEALIETVAPIGDEMRYLLKNDRGAIDKALQDGKTAAQERADIKLKQVMEVVGS